MLARANYEQVDPRTRPSGDARLRLEHLHAPSLWDIPADADLSDPASYPDWLTAGVAGRPRGLPRVSVHMEVFSPFTHLMELFGYENALMALIDAPDLCEALLEKLTAIVSAQVGATRDRARCPAHRSAFAGAGFISPACTSNSSCPASGNWRGDRTFSIPSYTHTCGLSAIG